MNLFGKNNNDTNQEGSENKKQTRGGINPIMKIIIAAYLVYTAYNLLKGIMGEGINSKNWFFLIFVVIFVGFAIWLFITSLKQLKEEKSKSDEEYAEMVAEEEDEKRLREMYSKEDLEAFEQEQALLSKEETVSDTEEDVEEDVEDAEEYDDAPEFSEDEQK